MEHHSTNSTYAIGGDSVGASTVLLEAATENIGKYGRMRREYLQEYQPELYNQLLLSGKLQVHLLEINYTAHQRLGWIMRELAKRAGATKELKASTPLKWAGLMGAVLCYYLNITPNIQELVSLCHSNKRSIICLVEIFCVCSRVYFVVEIGVL